MVYLWQSSVQIGESCGFAANYIPQLSVKTLTFKHKVKGIVVSRTLIACLEIGLELNLNAA